MRTDCAHYQSRTYSGGETVRRCELDLAPEAPWRCPEDCPAYSQRLIDVTWKTSALVEPPPPADAWAVWACCCRRAWSSRWS